MHGYQFHHQQQDQEETKNKNMKTVIEYSDELTERIEDAIAGKFHYKEKIPDPKWRPPTVEERREDSSLPREAPLVPNPVSRAGFVPQMIKERFLKPALIEFEAVVAADKAKVKTDKDLKAKGF